MQVQRDRQTERTARDKNKPADNVRDQGKELAMQADSAAQSGVNQLKQGVAQTKAKPAGANAKQDAKAQAKQQKDNQRAAKEAKKAAKGAGEGEDVKAPQVPAPNHEKGDAGPIQFKKIDDWNKYMPEALPDQDEREKQRILGLVKQQVNEERQGSAVALNNLRKAQLAQ